jgi:hypothetical protein
MTSRHCEHFHVGEFRIYGVNAAGYPKPGSPTADRDVAGLVNFARDAKTQVSVSGSLLPGANPIAMMTDGDPAKHWISQKEGNKWVEFAFAGERQIGCIQFLQGWQSKGRWNGLMDDYRVEYYDGKRWVEISSFDSKKGSADFARDFHTYGLEWSEKELVFYVDGKEIRREKNAFCHSPSPIWLSLAIIPWAGKITDSIHGTFMEVDYVRPGSSISRSAARARCRSLDAYLSRFATCVMGLASSISGNKGDLAIASTGLLGDWEF